MVIAYVTPNYEECCFELRDEYTELENFSSIQEFINYYAANRNRDIVLLYKVDTLEDIHALENMGFSSNIYMILMGKDDVAFSLLAGKLGVDIYLNIAEVDSDELIKYITNSQNIIKERKGNSNVSVFTGINGGVGTTTITMNLAKTIADEHLDKNVLLLDFTDTKAISNLFFDVIQPSKTIVDITHAQSMEFEELFNNGLMKLSNNLFFIPGIQKHTDKEEFSRTENIQIFLNFIMHIKESFDFILIDVGVFKDKDLEIDIQELADDIFVITEFNIPSMSILKTYIDIIDRSGWYNKTHIIANRADAYGSVTHEEAKKILSKGLKHNFEIAHSLPNDALHLRECWNEAKLVCDACPDAPFMDGLRKMINKFFIVEQQNNQYEQEHSKSILARIKEWL
ncbi:AAA family ATPase [Sulfurimonas sp. C5]|uniref:AAA family ATPase n=1 Tax=Sulfurimonas sp. C5 TaxID=3036947 RepID=UPI0024544ACA|nr:AAA family ATPase [Sulfurimonas sp. C5]MDH4944303.1 cellulose synthase operon protein YhjQ/BcsQ [Sulfurimonas sp. C5]